MSLTNVNNTELLSRQHLIGAAVYINKSGLNQGTSGNVSLRFEQGMLITPSATPYEQLTPASIAYMDLAGEDGAWQGPLKPSSEWQFHRDIYRQRPELTAIIHTHSPYATAVAITRREIPAAHYMIAAFGGNTIRCADYATFGTAELSKNVLIALNGRLGCLMANHGMLVAGANLEKTLWLAQELETLARQYYLSLQIGQPYILTEAEMAEVHERFKGYGLK